MSIITYPLDGVTYSAEDVATYLCTRTSGVYAKDSNFAVSITGTRQITIAPGLAWINYDDFKGVSVCSRGGHGADRARRRQHPQPGGSCGAAV